MTATLRKLAKMLGLNTMPKDYEEYFPYDEDYDENYIVDEHGNLLPKDLDYKEETDYRKERSRHVS